MARQALYVRRLKRSERKALERAAKRSRDARIVNRARMVLLSDQRKKTWEVGQILDVQPETVARWIRRYEEEGLDGLCDRSKPGCPPKADEAYQKRLVELVQSDPREVDHECPWGIWTVERLMFQMKSEGFVEVSDDTVRRVLHRRRFAFLRPKLDLKHKQNPREVRSFKRRLQAAKRGWMQIHA